MEKKLGVLALALCLICSLSFAQDTGTAQKSAKAKPTACAKKVTPPEKATPKVKMPEMPKIDPKVWDFLPETVAVVGQKKISKKELVKTLAPQVKMLLAMGQKLKPEQYQQLAKNMTDELIKATVLEKLAADAEYKVTPQLEESVYKKFTERFEKQLPKGQKISFADIIKKQGLKVSDVKKQLAEGEVVQKWIKEKVAKNITIDDAAAEKFYDKNKDRFFKRPETVTASHILIKPEINTKVWTEAKKKAEPKAWKETDATAWIKAKADAENVYKMVTEGKDFAELAKKYSQGPSAKNGGKLGTFAKGQMVPAFEKKCWKLVKAKDPELAKANKLNETGMVKTRFGWHIIKVTGYNPGGFVKLDKKLMGQIKEQLKQEKTSKKIKELVANETKALKPVINFKVEKPAQKAEKKAEE